MTPQNTPDPANRIPADSPAPEILLARQRALEELSAELSAPISEDADTIRAMPGGAEAVSNAELFGRAAATGILEALEQQLHLGAELSGTVLTPFVGGNHTIAGFDPENDFGWTLSGPAGETTVEVRIGSLPRKVMLNDKDDPSLGPSRLYVMALGASMSGHPEEIAAQWVSHPHTQAQIGIHGRSPGIMVQATSLNLSGEALQLYMSAELTALFGDETGEVMVRSRIDTDPDPKNPQAGYRSVGSAIPE